MTYFNDKERMKEWFDDFFADVSEGTDPEEVADAILESLQSWIKYHKDALTTYEAVRNHLRK